MNRIIDQIPKDLNKNNIESAISNYYGLLKNIPLKIESKNVLKMLTDLKRKKIEYGPYPNVTLFESANRIMSDLTILHGVKDLLNGCINEIDFDQYTVEFGHDNYHENDITATNGQIKLIGEGFNVAKSFFQSKKASALRKMRRQKKQNDKLLLIYNSDAVSDSYKPELKQNEFHLKVSINFSL
ncbi:MAG: hypothetical protein WD048_15255 [Chitinophagales bacterium]